MMPLDLVYTALVDWTWTIGERRRDEDENNAIDRVPWYQYIHPSTPRSGNHVLPAQCKHKNAQIHMHRQINN
jgi:hypothetical protein